MWRVDLSSVGSVMLESEVESHSWERSGEFCGELKMCVE